MTELTSLASNLHVLGFSSNEVDVYLALLKHAPCHVAPLIKETKLHRNLVYIALERLIDRKLVSEKIMNGKKKFHVLPPDIIQKEFEQKSKVAENVVKALSNVGKFEMTEVNMYVGQKEYNRLISEMDEQLKQDDEILRFGVLSEKLFDPIDDPIIKERFELFRKKNIKLRIIAGSEKKKSIRQDLENYKELNIKVHHFAPQIADPARIYVYPNQSVMIFVLYPDENGDITAIKFKNAIVTKGVVKLFESLWKISIF